MVYVIPGTQTEAYDFLQSPTKNNLKDAQAKNTPVVVGNSVGMVNTSDTPTMHGDASNSVNLSRPADLPDIAPTIAETNWDSRSEVLVSSDASHVSERCKPQSELYNNWQQISAGTLCQCCTVQLCKGCIGSAITLRSYIYTDIKRS